jgi:hypothetical protein
MANFALLRRARAPWLVPAFALAALFGLAQAAPVRAGSFTARWQAQQQNLLPPLFARGTAVSVNNTLFGPLFGGNLNGAMIVNFNLDTANGTVMGGAFSITQFQGRRLIGALFGIITTGDLTLPKATDGPLTLQTLSFQMVGLAGVGTFSNALLSRGVTAGTVIVDTTLSNMTGGLMPLQVIAIDGVTTFLSLDSFLTNFQFGDEGDDD